MKIRHILSIFSDHFCNFTKTRTLMQIYFSEFGEVFQNNFFIEHFQATLENLTSTSKGDSEKSDSKTSAFM